MKGVGFAFTMPVDPPSRVGAVVTEQTFAEFYSDEYRGMVRVAWLVVGSRAIAEELVQDAFMRVSRRFPTLDRPPAYLRTAVVNACRNELRRSRRLTSEPVPDRVAEQSSMVELLDSLRALDHRQRAAIVLRYVDDRTDRDIGHILGVREATVRSLIFRGLTKLRKDDS
jgi:RNA polymerase sigma factor (sigma-70 family)